jgi:lipopolysaccharide biosynthesis glycosyltransferase
MIAAFLHVGDDPSLPAILVASLRNVMPSTRVVQLSDKVTAAVPGVDEVVRRDWDGVRLMTFRLEHYAALPEDQWLLLDTDMVVQADVSVVFELDRQFDVAMHRRESTIVRPPAWEAFPELIGQDLASFMPYNTGVIFSRTAHFWSVARDRLAALEERYHRWFGDQVAVRMAVEGGGFRVLDLHPAFNYTPQEASDDVRRAYIVHYKGPRKAWMQARHGAAA